MNLSCHLESADSVRTNPESEHFEQHSNRFFAEAFTRLLFGEQIRSGQIPLFDSFGAVHFYSDLLAAVEHLEPDRAMSILPLVMTHFPGLNDKHRWDSQSDWHRVYADTISDRVQSPTFRLSAMPDLQDEQLRHAVGDWFARATEVATDEFPAYLERDLTTRTLTHLRRLCVLNNYFHKRWAATRPNAAIDSFHLPGVIFRALDKQVLRDAQVLPYDPNLQPVVDFYQKLLEDNPSPNRTLIYKRIEAVFDGQPQSLLAKELIDSFYMWEQACNTGAGVEITSSGIETDDEELRRLGQVVNEWADKTKTSMVKQAVPTSIRPVLQRGIFTGIDSLSNASYRSALTQGLASLWLSSPDLVERRVNLARSGPQAPQRIVDFWQGMVQKINSYADLCELIKVNVTEHGVLVCRFCMPAGRDVHQVGATAEGIQTDPETTDKIRDAFEQVEDASEREGNVIEL